MSHMETKFKISDRLKKIASFLPKGASFADIGSDHAYLPCYVCLGDPTSSAVAGEVREGPYNSAVKNVQRMGLSHAIEVRLGDGLDILKDKDTIRQVVIAGMGGTLITEILEKGKKKLANIERIIVQPNVGAEFVREWLLNNAFMIVDEAIIEENGHIYEIIVANKGASTSPYEKSLLQQQLLFGPFLLKEMSETFYKKWKEELKSYSYVLGKMKQASVKNDEKIAQYEQRIKWIREVLENESRRN